MFDQRKCNQDLYEGAMAQAAYDGEQKGLKQGIKQGIEEGLKEGSQQKTREIVLSSYKEGISIDLIAKITGIAVDEIEAILSSNLV